MLSSVFVPEVEDDAGKGWCIYELGRFLHRRQHGFANFIELLDHMNGWTVPNLGHEGPAGSVPKIFGKSDVDNLKAFCHKSVTRHLESSLHCG